MPVDIDVIEQLYALGEVTVESVCAMASDRDAAWRVISSLVTANAAALFVAEPAGPRALRDWEVAALIRNRVNGSPEATPTDNRLLLRATEGTKAAYDRDFGAWFYGDKR